MQETARQVITVEQVYAQHADFAWRILRRLGVPEHDLPDATQEVFLAVHRTLGSFEGRSSITTWLFTICRSTARDRRRRASTRHEVVPDDNRIDGEIDLQADVHQAAETNERLVLLESILGGLEPEQRAVFILFEIESMTGDEISHVLSIPLGTVYSRLGLARKAFRQALARHQAREASQALRTGERA